FFTTKKRGQGTGLGLTVVSQIVSCHKARIELRSEAAGGTKVTLLWPTMTPTTTVKREVPSAS
ncbi:MAG: ATP-binding protein, partial [Patescibacteria group bacterium]